MKVIHSKMVLVLLVFCLYKAHGQNQVITMKKGQVISLITSKQLEGADDLKNEYYQTVFPIANRFGFKLEQSFSLLSINAQGYDPFPIMNLFSWPNQEARKKFQSIDEWEEIEALRPKIWEELRICRGVLDRDMTLELAPGKTYRIVFAWLNKDNPGDFDKYLARMKETRERLGARYVLEVNKDIAFHSFDDPTPPDRFWIIEWPSAEAHAEYIQSDAFQENKQYFFSGLAKFHGYETRLASN